MGSLFDHLVNPPSVEQYPTVLHYFASVYLLWGLMWGLVAIHYGRAAHLSWKQQGGEWRHCIRDFFAPFSFAWYQLLCKLRILRNPDICDTEIPARYTVGHYLRFSIFLGALSPMMLITLTAATDRTRWSFLSFGIAMFLLVISTMGAGGHLFIAYRLRPNGWCLLVILATLWLGVAPQIFKYIHWPV